METHLDALRTDGWLSLPASKLLLAVAVKARQTELAEHFIRYPGPQKQLTQT